MPPSVHLFELTGQKNLYNPYLTYSKNNFIYKLKLRMRLYNSDANLDIKNLLKSKQ
jgi:hypothetical protein